MLALYRTLTEVTEQKHKIRRKLDKRFDIKLLEEYDRLQVREDELKLQMKIKMKEYE